MAVISKHTAHEAVVLFKTFIGKPRTTLPWLKNRVHMLDCAAGYSWISGLKPEQISCSRIKAICEKNGTYARSGIPQIGDAVFFDWKGNKVETDHVGMVVSATKTSVTYVSADSGDHQLVTVNTIGYKWITGWGKPVTWRTATVAPAAPVSPVAPVTPSVPVKPAAPAVKPVTVVVQPGDSYWAIATRTLGVKNTPLNALRINKETKRIQALNANKALKPNDTVRVR
jgi:LysM repeat protein